MKRLLLALFALLVVMAAPARADDISAAGRGVVRIVTIAIVDDEVVAFGHGSGFAVSPNRILTNAHVVEAASRYPGNVIIGVVPSEGQKSYQGRLIAVDQDRDLALIEFTGAKLPPLTLFTGSLDEGEAMVALGYPGNVDLATARSAADFITPLIPVRSEGVFSGRRTLAGTEVILHTADIARGNSGGPLLDRCGRVLGINSAITRADDGDSGFAFAVSEAEIAAFLRDAKQAVGAVGGPCVTIEERLAQEREASDRDAATTAEQGRAAVLQAQGERATRIEAARQQNESTRENYIAVAAVLLVLGALAIGGAGLLVTRDLRNQAIGSAVAGALLMVGAVVTFLLRPTFDPAMAAIMPAASQPIEPNQITGKLICSVVPERSRITVSQGSDRSFDWSADGCADTGSQYVETPEDWQRVLIPADEQTVTLREYHPDTGTLIDSRYMLTSAQMTEARRLAGVSPVKACSIDQSALAKLADRQRSVRESLPPLPNERIVYHCAAAP